MANKKITELPAATVPLNAGDILEIVQGGVNKQVAKSDVATGGGGTVTSVTGTTNRITSTGGATPVIDIDAAYDAIVAAKAPIASPTFTGTPAAPTAAQGTNTTQVATTAFVAAATPAASETVSGIIELATAAEVLAVTDTARAVTPAGLAVFKVDSAAASTAGGTITLDMNSHIQRMFVGSASFASAKILALSNTTNALFFNFVFEITNVAAVLTMPTDFIMSDPAFDGDDWTPAVIGIYELGGSWNGANWIVKIAGPFT